jgi:hypothetical protein
LFINARAEITNANERELNKKEGPVPKVLIINPETAGPNSLAVLKFTDLRLIEFEISSGGTN